MDESNKNDLIIIIIIIIIIIVAEKWYKILKKQAFQCLWCYTG